MEEAESGEAESVTMPPEILIKKQWSYRDILANAEDPGRKWGQTAGTYIDDLTALQKTLILCPNCKKGINWRRQGYYNVEHFEHTLCQGTCDGCHVHTNRGTLLLHETNVHSCWMTIDERKKFRRLPGSPMR